MHVPRNTGFIIKGAIQPSICYKVRVPSGVFGVASLALYALAPNHVFRQMLGLSGGGVLDKGVSGQPDYILWPDCWTMKIQD